jgi:hypothetical protein
MEFNEYIKHMHALVSEFEAYWKQNAETNESFPMQLPIESWDEQFDFFAELPTNE